MTESNRRSGEHEHTYQGGAEQTPYRSGDRAPHPYQGGAQPPAPAPAGHPHPVPPRPAAPPAADAAQAAHAADAAPSDPVTAVNPEWPPPPYEPRYGTPQGQPAHEPSAGPRHGGSYGPPQEPPHEPPAGAVAPEPKRRRRHRGPAGLLVAVAVVAAAVGGGTAYGIQELTGSSGTAATSSTSTNVVPSSQKGTVAGVAEAVTPSIVEINAKGNAGSSTGAGVIITADGEIITNNHVIAGASQVEVTTSDGTRYSAQVVGTDSSKDLALIKLDDASGLKAATLGDSDGLQVGDQVVAIGSPEGLTGTVTSGIVSALDRDVTVSTEEGQQQQQRGGGWPFEFGGREFNGDTGSSTTTYQAIQTDASLNPGNSGGALIDMNGNIIGINSAMYSSGASSSADAGSVGLGFAIPVNTVKADLDALRAGSMN